MQIDFLDYLFEGVIFILILQQSKYYLITYLLPMIKDEHEITFKEKERNTEAIEKAKKNITTKKLALVNQIEHLATLEIMVDRWQKKNVEKQEKQNKERALYFQLFSEKLKVQLTNHAQKKNKINALELCSADALIQIQANSPLLCKKYTEKMLSQFFKQNKEKQ